MKAERNQYDQMTPKERRIAMESGKETDRIPVIPFIGELSGRLIGVNTQEYWHDADKLVLSELAAFRRFGHDELSLGPNTCGIVEALGGKVSYPKEGMPYFEGHLLDGYEKIKEMEPVRWGTSKRLGFFREALEKLKEAAGDVVDVSPSIGGPFTIASNLRGCEYFLRDLRKAPKEVHQLLRIVTDTMKSVIDMIAPFADGFRMADPVASPALISPKYFKEFAYPYLVEIMEYGTKKIGRKPSLHICGNTKKVWTYFRQMPIRAVSLDNIMSLEEAKEELGDRFIIMGNIAPVDLILNGTNEQLQDEIQREIDVAKDSPKGYIMSSGCDVPYFSDIGKLDLWMEEVRKYFHLI